MLKKELIQKIAIVLFFIMFIYSGLNKIINFKKKINGLDKKIYEFLSFKLSNIFLYLGMIIVILLEIIGSLIIVYYFLGGKYFSKKYIEYLLIIYLLFLIIVTILYHPPTDKIIPFLSNMTTFGGLLLIYNIV